MSRAEDARADPGLDCLTGKCLFVDIVDKKSGEVVGCWCLCCGGGSYDGDRVTADGKPVGFRPKFRIRIPDGFHR